MLHKHFHFVVLIAVSLLLKGTACFFVKAFLHGLCMKDTGHIQSSGSWGKLLFIRLFRNANTCLDPSAQFRFRDNGAMLNLKSQGCVAAFNKNGSGLNLDMLYLYVDSHSLDTNACAQKPNESIYRAITQTPYAELSVYYKGKNRSSFETWRVTYQFSYILGSNYAGLSTTTRHQRFFFGSVACYGKTVVNANCPKDQYMIVQTASYRGLPESKKCGLSDDYICQVDVTCIVKKKCDGVHECNITVDDKLISNDLCPGLSNYLYFEYQCFNAKNPYKGHCVHDIFLSNSSEPSRGVLQMTDSKETKNVCGLWFNQQKADRICQQMGYLKAFSFVSMPNPMGAKAATLSRLFCTTPSVNYLKCAFAIENSESCLVALFLKCGCFKLMLSDKQRFPDSLFSASASSKINSASQARASSGSSWCAPTADGKHYLQVDLVRLYHLDYLVTYGDTTSKKWVVTYKLEYTTDLINWKTVRRVLQGNKYAFDQAAEQFPDVITKALRLTPLAYVGEPCIRVDFGGKTVLPDQPTNVTVTNITSSSAKISWVDPLNQGIFNLSRFWIIVKKNDSLLLDVTTPKLNDYQVYNLTPFTEYQISVTAGNSRGFGEEFAVKTFSTSEEAPSGTPLNIQTISRSASSLFITWYPPEKSRRNGVIVSYTACILHSKYGPCIQSFTTSKKDWLVGNLNTSAIYYVRVLASTKFGPGNYSESKAFSTNGKQAENVNQTSRTLTFSLKIPTKTFLYFYVVALRLTDAQRILSPENYKDIDLKTYDWTKNRTNPKPYVAAVFTYSSVDGEIFVLGDGIMTDDPTSRTTSDYFNGPLKPGTSYRIFQRVIINKKGDQYSTDWSSASKTSDIKDTLSGAGESYGSEKYFFAIVGVLAILLVISFLFNAYSVYQIHFKSQSTKAEAAGPETTNRNNLENANDSTNRIDASNYEQMGDEQHYTDLHTFGVGEYDDRSYAHLNQVADVYVMQEETGI